MTATDPKRPFAERPISGNVVSKFRVKFIAIYVLAVFPIGVMTAQVSSLVQNIAFGGFFLLALLQFYVRCESCGSTIVDYMFHWDDSWFNKPSPFNPIFSDHCPKCGLERF